ncbi:MAG: opacity protein-like surface antigen [Paraglaciecola sp.]
MKGNTVLNTNCLLPLLIIISTSSYADTVAENNHNSAGSYYVSASVGQAKYDRSREDIRFGDEVRINAFDNSDTSFKLLGGYKLNKFLSFEIGYISMGELSSNQSYDYSLPVVPPEGGTVTLGSAVEVSGFVVNAVASYPLGNNFSIYSKLGAFSWSADSKLRTINIHTDTNGSSEFITSESNSENSTDLIFAAGVSFHWSNFTINVEFEQFKMNGANLSASSIGGSYYF